MPSSKSTCRNSQQLAGFSGEGFSGEGFSGVEGFSGEGFSGAGLTNCIHMSEWDAKSVIGRLQLILRERKF